MICFIDAGCLSCHRFYRTETCFNFYGFVLIGAISSFKSSLFCCSAVAKQLFATHNSTERNKDANLQSHYTIILRKNKEIEKELAGWKYESQR